MNLFQCQVGKSDVNNHGNHPTHEAKGDSMSDQVVDSPSMTDVEGHNLHPLTWIIQSQDKLHRLPQPKKEQDNLHRLTWFSQSSFPQQWQVPNPEFKFSQES